MSRGSELRGGDLPAVVAGLVGGAVAGFGLGELLGTAFRARDGALCYTMHLAPIALGAVGGATAGAVLTLHRRDVWVAIPLAARRR